MRFPKACAAAAVLGLGAAFLSGCATETVCTEDGSYTYVTGDLEGPSGGGFFGFLLGLILGVDDDCGDDDGCHGSYRHHGGGGGHGGGGDDGRVMDQVSKKIGRR